MFTGIVDTIGILEKVTPLSNGVEGEFSAPSSFLERFGIGDSVAVNGVCCTVMYIKGEIFRVQLLQETLSCTNLGGLQLEEPVNLERALSPDKTIGGHFVTGHVDEAGVVKMLSKGNPFGEIVVEYGAAFQPFLVQKGSVSVDGIGLTVVELTNETFSCHVIPHPMKATILSKKKIGDKINIEYDLLGKYAYRFYTLEKGKHHD